MNKKDLQAAYNAKKEMSEHYKELFSASVSEVRFLRLQVDLLVSALDELTVVTADGLVIDIIRNTLDRKDLDTRVHNRGLTE